MGRCVLSRSCLATLLQVPACQPNLELDPVLDLEPDTFISRLYNSISILTILR